uniref:ATPase family AAA domain containing 5a n=1 Tax=Periophthalmus magnuspinnatus TaxID=409849 RepID=A0A3B4BJ30_9GOBI
SNINPYSTNNEICEETESVTENKQIQITNTENNHISPRMVTIQAEVHPISTKEEDKNAGKVASIFTKGKSTSPAPATSPQPESDLQVQPTASKWKSNVVLEEDYVELCVLESSSIPKCSQAERKQFMAAFKQPAIDGSKNKPIKTHNKPKQSGDTAADATDKVGVEEAEIQCTDVQEKNTSASQNKKVKKKRQKKANVKKDTTSPPTMIPEKEPAVMEVIEIDSKKQDQPTTSPPSPVVRRSRREAVTRLTSKPNLAKSSPKQIKKVVSTECDAVSNQGALTDLSTPKKRRTKLGVFKAEMTCPPDEMASPIRNGTDFILFKTFQSTKESKETKQLEQKTEGVVPNVADSDRLPVCETGCTETMLGLLNIAPQQNIWELLKRQEADFSNLVTMGRGQGVALLYPNIENLLPLPTTRLDISKLQQPISPSLDQSHKLSSNARLRQNEDDVSDDASPVKVSNRMKKNRRRHCPVEQGALQSDLDSEDEFLSLKQQSATQEKEDAKLVPLKIIRKPLSRQEQIKSVPVSQCLQSLADFLDNMSSMDFLSINSCNLREMGSAAVIKDGLTDEARVESEMRNLPMRDCALEIHAQVESLSFNKCSASVSSAWHKVQQLDGELRKQTADLLTLPIACHNESFTFLQSGLCHPQVVQQRREVMDELCIKRVFGSLANRPAVAQDYLPALRAICKSEQLKEKGKVKRRFLHYLDAIHLGLQKSTLKHLAEDFP